jgi:hypothetical protein
MTRILQTIGVSTAFALASFIGGQAVAMPLGGSGKAALERIGVVAQAQYTYEGKEYCWYDDGWNGPGWYVCGQYTVKGVGWGGGAGWHGWSHSSTTVVHGRTSRGRTVTSGSGRTDGHVGGRTGGGRTGGHASGRTGGGRTGGGHSGGGRTGGGKGGGGKGHGRR